MTTQFGQKSKAVFGGRGAEREKLLFIAAAGLAFSLLVILVLVFQFKNSADAGQVAQEAVVLPAATNTVALLTPELTIRSGTKLTDVRLKEIPWPMNQVPDDAVRDPAEVRNMFARIDISAGVPLQRSQVTEDQMEVTLPLTPGNRAVTIQVDEVTSVENHARPGTRVDVVLTYYIERELTSKVIVQNARVLSLGGDTASGYRPGRGVKSNQTTITLDVGPGDALEIQTAKKLGSLGLMMRSSEDYRPLEKIEVDSKQIDGNSRHQPEPKQVCKKGTVRVSGQEFIMNCDGSLSAVKN